jgi:hypothetical protein
MKNTTIIYDSNHVAWPLVLCYFVYCPLYLNPGSAPGGPPTPTVSNWIDLSHLYGKWCGPIRRRHSHTGAVSAPPRAVLNCCSSVVHVRELKAWTLAGLIYWLFFYDAYVSSLISICSRLVQSPRERSPLKWGTAFQKIPKSTYFKFY